MEASTLRHAPAHGLRGPTPFLRLQSDERLVALTRRGNQAAYEALVARYQSRLHAFCRHMLGSKEDAEDVLQEVFAAAYNAMLGDDRTINVRPWLYRIARNRSLNHLRKATAVGMDSMDVHLAEHGATTADKVHERETFRQLVADVQDLPETQRTALLLREIDALSYEQIAEAMETTVPSVKSLLVRARVSLAEAAEARRMTCVDVREELGEVAEGLKARSSAPVRRHLRSCDRCAGFRKELRATNKALAAVFPVGPLLLLKKLLLAHLGTTASAAGGGAAATAAGAGAGAAGSGVLSAGVTTVASKAAAGLAAAAIVTAGAVEVDHVRKREPVRAATAATAPAVVRPPEPTVVAARPQPAAIAATSHVAQPTTAVADDPKADPAADLRNTRKDAAADAKKDPAAAAAPAGDAVTGATPAATPAATGGAALPPTEAPVVTGTQAQPAAPEVIAAQPQPQPSAGTQPVTPAVTPPAPQHEPGAPADPATATAVGGTAAPPEPEASAGEAQYGGGTAAPSAP